MNSFLVILSCLAAVSLANPAPGILVEFRNGVTQCRINCARNRLNPTWGDCPPVDCGPPMRHPTCGAPDCTHPGNRHVLHSHPDPNFFWQCGPINAITWGAIERKCGCGTLFSHDVDPTRCVHPHEWHPSSCPMHPNNPVTNPDHCSTECPDCGPGNGNVVWNPQNPWNRQPNIPQIPQHPSIPQVPNPPQSPWNQQPNFPQQPSIPQVPNPPQHPWNQQPNNPWNQEPNPWDQQQPNPWDQQQPNPWDQQQPNPWDQQPTNPRPWDQQPNNPQRPWNPQPPQPQPIWPQW